MSRKAVLIPEAEAVLIPEVEIERRLEIPEGTFKDFYTYGVDSLKHIFPPDGKLPVIRKGNGGRAGFDYFCDERHIENIERIPRLKDGKLLLSEATRKEGKVIHCEVTYLTHDKANNDYGISRSYLDSGTKSILVELGRKIESITLVVREENLFRFREMTLFNEGDCEKIQKARDGDDVGDRIDETPAAEKPNWRTTADLLKAGYTEDELKKYVREDGRGTRRVNRRNSSGKINRVREWNDEAVARVDKARERHIPPNAITDRKAAELGFKPSTLARWHKQGKLRRWCIDIRTGKRVSRNQCKRGGRYHVMVSDKAQLNAILARAPIARDAPHFEGGFIFEPLSVLANRFDVGAGLLFNWLKWCRWLKRKLFGKEIDRVHKRIPNGRLNVANPDDVAAAVENWRKRFEPNEPWPMPTPLQPSSPPPAAEAASPIVNGNDNSEPIVEMDDRPPVHRFRDKEYDFIYALFDLGAFSKAKRRSIREVAVKAHGKYGTMRRVASLLKSKGLIETIQGIYAGCFFTAEGKRLAESLQI
ncbi:MAG: hypothetical protein FJ271_31520 [Planctomycetes bacterium]|nr:hypothetical protein [Planctomycetota bacterium]